MNFTPKKDCNNEYKMKSTVTIVLIIALTVFCQAECPIECYCDRVTICIGNNLLTRFSKIYAGVDSPHYTEPFLNTAPIRLELHNFAVKHLTKQDFLNIVGNLSELSLSRNSLEIFDNDTFSLDLTSSLSTSSVLSSLYSSKHAAIVGSGATGADNLRDAGSKNIGSSESDEMPEIDFPLSTNTGEAAAQVSRNQDVSRALSSSDRVDTCLQLRILDLSQNRLKYFVGGGKLCKLRILDLSSNMLQQVYGLSAIQNLESVNLRDNRIAYLDANIFQNLRNLQYVNLDANILGFVHPSTFSNLPMLAHLILSSNPISNLLSGFYWNSHVHFVDVSNIGLTSIPSSPTKTVRDFRCANNNLTIIKQTDFESYPNVRLVVLDENAIENVEDDAFGRLDFLSRLCINRNRLRKIPLNLPPSLRFLQLESNLIVNLTSADFKNLHQLEELNLHSNQITSLSPQIFSELTSLKSLNLRSNLIDVIYRDSFANLSKLETLDISQNPIKVIVTGAFELLRRVTILHLSGLMEPIELDVRTFQPFQNLNVFELDESPHLTRKLFEDGGFSQFPNLFELNIQQCGLEDINLVSNALVELNLHTVKMNANPWNCKNLHELSVHELISRQVIIDRPTCARPPHLRNTALTTLNVTTSKISVQDTGDHPPITPSSAFPISQNVQNTKTDHQIKKILATTLASQLSSNNSGKTTDRLSFSTSTRPITKLIPPPPSSSTSTTSIYSPSTSAPGRNIDTNTLVDVLESDSDLVSTQSYFEYPTSPSKNKDYRTSESDSSRTSGGSGTKYMAAKSESEPTVVGKLTNRTRQSAADNQTLSKLDSPNYSYLKVGDSTKRQRGTHLRNDDSESSITDSHNMTVIVQIIVISAITCLASICGILFISIVIYRYALKRRQPCLVSCCRSCSQEQGEDTYHHQPPGAGMNYTRLTQQTSSKDLFSGYFEDGSVSSNISSSSITNFSHRCSHPRHQNCDCDQVVELSGMANSVHNENEAIIYHIT